MVGIILAVAFACLGGEYVIHIFQNLEKCLHDYTIKTAPKNSRGYNHNCSQEQNLKFTREAEKSPFFISFLFFRIDIFSETQVEILMSKKNENATVEEMLEPKTGKRFISTYDANKLRRLINEGKNAKEIMSELNITHSQVLKHHLLKLSTTDRKYYEIPGLYQRNDRQAFVNAKGEIKLKMNNIDFGENTFPPETEFSVQVSNNQIILTVITPSEPKPMEAGEIDADKTQDDQSF